MPLVSQAEFAAMMGVSSPAVLKAIKAGRVKSWKEVKGKVRIDAEKAKAEWIANTQKRTPIQEEMRGVQGPSINQSRTILEEYRAKMAQADYEEKIGTLVLGDTVKKQAFASAREARDRLMNIPDRVAGLVAAESSERACHEILVNEIRSICDELSRLGEEKEAL